MAEQPMIVVRGTAQQEVPPDLAVFTVTVSARDRSRDTVMKWVALRSDEVRKAIEAHPVERRETERVLVYPELRDRREKVAAYVASVTTRVTVSEFERLGELLLELGRIDQAVVAGPWWSLRPDSRAGADVRTAAVNDALRRAADYAAAVGARVERLIDIVEDGSQVVQPMALAAFGRARSSGAAEAVPELELDPELQTVNADLTVRVAITAPTLS